MRTNVHPIFVRECSPRNSRCLILPEMPQNTKLQKDSLVFRKRGTALPRLNTEEIRTDNEIHCVRAHSSTVTHPSTIRARLRVTSGSNFVDAITTLPLCQTATNRERGVSPSHAHSSEAFRYSTLLSIPLLGLARRPWFATLSVGQAAQKYSLVQGSEANSWR